MQEQNYFLQFKDFILQFGSKGEISNNNLIAHLASCITISVIAIVLLVVIGIIVYVYGIKNTN
ncbi:MAG: hypothetical protein AB7E76_03750 [Deferribacterales bacterium]